MKILRTKKRISDGQLRPGRPNDSLLKSRNRIMARTSKIRALTDRQIKQLRRWLLLDKLTYAQARVHLRERFGLDFSSGTLCHFWQQYCVPIAPPARERHPAVFLDVVLQSSKPIRVRVMETKSRLRFKVGTQRQRALIKEPTFTIHPTGADTPKP